MWDCGHLFPNPPSGGSGDDDTSTKEIQPRLANLANHAPVNRLRLATFQLCHFRTHWRIGLTFWSCGGLQKARCEAMVILWLGKGHGPPNESVCYRVSSPTSKVQVQLDYVEANFPNRPSYCGVGSKRSHGESVSEVQSSTSPLLWCIIYFNLP